MAFIEPMHRNKPNITYLLTYSNAEKNALRAPQICEIISGSHTVIGS